MNEEFITSKDLRNRIMDKFDGTSQSFDVNYYYVLDKIGEFISDYRFENNLTQKQLAEKINVSQAMVAKYESGEYNFSLRSLMKLMYDIGQKISISFYRVPKALKSEKFLGLLNHSNPSQPVLSRSEITISRKESNSCVPWSVVGKGENVAA